MSQTSVNMVTRIMGLILAAMSIEFIVSGTKLFYRVWRDSYGKESV